ncbi:ABC transporter ATP-binding protein [Bacillus niameyensis]|uniref:ABC transporter ATP-binding protein n=1 Tax=Bacillus niameyensis TaxID=1522308 RepID=UPI0007828FD2|nr:ABC transporter ATP-binding protein [Bacillus niameyensis]
MKKRLYKIRELRSQFREFIEVANYLKLVLWQASRTWTVLLFTLNIFGGLTLAIELWAMTSLINLLIEQGSIQHDFKRMMLTLLPWVLLFIGAMLIKNTVNAIQPYISKQLQEKTSSILKNDIYEKAVKLDLRSFETEDYYNRLENAKRSTNAQLTYAIESVGFMIGNIFELIVIITAISQGGLLLALFLLAASIPLIIVNIKTSQEFVRINYRQSPLKRQLQYWLNISTSRSTAAELRLFELGPFFLKNWKKLSDQIIGELHMARKNLAFTSAKSTILMMLTLITMIIGIVYTGASGVITVGALVAFLYMLNRYQDAIRLIAYYSEMLSDFYFQFQHVPQFLQSGEEELQKGVAAPQKIQQGIVFENVDFTYPGSAKPSLQNISFQIRPGEKLAVVGENGAGKSTLALLLLGLYEPTEGRILIDGIDLKTINPHSWRRKAAAVFQNFVKYQLSVEENIVYGDIFEKNNLERLRQSAEKSGVDEVLHNLPHGYQTLLGREYENSKDLSGGEWQKVAIARAYFKEADLLVLDEPTAALDAQSEYEVYRQFSEVSDGKTSMLISHRLGSARLADKIIYLQAGELVEIGTHEELLAQNGSYSKVYHQQAEWYQQEESFLG